MSDFSSTSVSFPIPHNSNDKRPLPEIIADHCGFPLASHPKGDKTFYSVQDWISGVAHPKNPARFWSDMKRLAKVAEIQLYDSVVYVPYRAKDGKRYKMEHVTDESLYRITQRMRAETGIRDQVLQFLAKAGVVVDEYRIDPEKAIDAAIAAYKRQGKTLEWIEVRIRTKVGRMIFTGSFQRSLRIPPAPKQFALITDEMRIGLWKRRTKALKAELGLREKDSLRDHMSRIALNYEALAESLSAYELDQKSNLEFEQAKFVVRSNSEFVGQHAEKASRRLNIDIPTNRPLLPDKLD
jgi:hypothetical protein